MPADAREFKEDEPGASTASSKPVLYSVSRSIERDQCTSYRWPASLTNPFSATRLSDCRPVRQIRLRPGILHRVATGDTGPRLHALYPTHIPPLKFRGGVVHADERSQNTAGAEALNNGWGFCCRAGCQPAPGNSRKMPTKQARTVANPC